MRLLFKLAGQNKKIYRLLIVTVISMILFSLASQMEIFSLRIITDKGADFFELFTPEDDGSVTKEEVRERWDDIDTKNTGVITKESAARYITVNKSKNKVTLLIQWLNGKVDLSSIKNLAIMILIIGIFKAMTQFAHQYSMRLVGIRVSKNLRESYFDHLQTLSMDFYHKYHVGSLSARVSGDAGVVSDAINSFFINYLHMPFVMVTALVMLFLSSWKLSMIIFVGSPMIIFPIIFLAKRIRKISKLIQKNQENFGSVLLDFLSGVQTVKIFVMEKFAIKKYREQNDHMAVLEEKNARYSLSSRPVLHMIGMFFLSIVLLYGIYVAHMNISELIFFCALLKIFYDPIKQFAEENAKIQRGIAAAERMFEVLTLKPKVKDSKGAITFKGLKDKIEFDDVWFKYNDEWVLKGLSFTIEKGKTTAFVGPTGAGKSTIAQLLPRLYDVQRGEIRVDGIPITEYKQKSIREGIGFVPQKPFIFYDTVAENISFGRDFTRKEILSAAKKAHADEFIQNLPGKYDFFLAETGKNLSGGQQQRLAIARALVKDASILLMDEATSALDAVSENKIKEAVMDLRGDITQVLIAHRLSTIEYADKIIYLEYGEKIAEGTKDELLETCPSFKAMWDMMMYKKPPEK
ncbi:MAG: ABC transporter ATP-binding protein [Waddliaceae bacterium]|jgi:ABC-type multidrug transport system fused ATPase/permease subunit|nr:ABC transporter ATP-binding protein [Waddliaceae bacterium]MBT3578799.1 ABC transporter ATP-binding protein [Waddliaceae bacterium]MBT4444334.1 ABC transporter ATP-binding protein [Waddliaceae bacterium]MBT6928215.1 ABC transporter ATP-binding protein [Waddliaceae bacterium]MBT7264198.1 ABC transporter ATP-binding protein [Waddliaceae bacterium]